MKGTGRRPCSGGRTIATSWSLCEGGRWAQMHQTRPDRRDAPCRCSPRPTDDPNSAGRRPAPEKNFGERDDQLVNLGGF